MRNFRLRNVGFVSSVEEQERVMIARILDPTRELIARRDRTGRIVRETKINKIDMFLWRLGHEIVFRGAR